MEVSDSIPEVSPEYFSVFRASIHKEVNVHIVGLILGANVSISLAKSFSI